ncbi:MAG TPA: ABC transporter permease [Gammaproteobacteria bacterium]
MLDDVWSDIRYAVRSLTRAPAFTAAAIVTIALGVGVNAGIFTVLNGVLFRDLPAPDAHELVSIRQYPDGGRVKFQSGAGTFSVGEYHAYRDGTQTLSGVLAHSNPLETTLGGDAPQQMFGVLVSCNYFAVLESPPALGRALTDEDCALGAPPVVVLGHSLWTRTFDADPGIVGRTIELNRQLFTVVGVAAAGTYGGSPMTPGYFAPISADPLVGRSPERYENNDFHWLTLIGRRAEGASIEQARAELAAIAAQIDELDPGRATALEIERATPATVPPQLRGPATGAGVVLMAAFGFILLIACANVANLLLARGTARSQELGIRLSLGANRARIVRQLLTESLLISIIGGLIGCIVALISFPVLVLWLPGLVPPELPSFELGLDLSPDHRVLAFAAGVTLLSGLVFGLAPALHVSKPDLHAVIKQGTAGGTGQLRGGRLRGTLVGVQVALSMALMIAAGLLLRGLYTAHTIDPGFEHENVAYVTFGIDGLQTDADPARFLRRLRGEIGALPGVEAVELASDPPLGEEMAAISVRLPGDPPNETRLAELNNVTPGYFRLVGIPIVRGRTFTDAEHAGARDETVMPAIVSETTARRYWPDADPLDQTLLAGERTLRVVGVARDAGVSTLGRIPTDYVYLPGGEEVLIKSRLDIGALSAAVHGIVRSLDPGLVVRVLPLEANLGFWRGLSGTVTALGGALGALALVLASIGIYGVVSYAVTRRYREIGVRIVLGANARQVLATILRRTLPPVLIGAAVGFAGGNVMSGILAGVLFGVSPADPVGIGGAAAFVLVVAFAAAVLAARPAAYAEPTSALRYE